MEVVVDICHNPGLVVHGFDVVAYDQGCYHAWEATHMMIHLESKLEAGIDDQVLQNTPPSLTFQEEPLGTAWYQQVLAV